MAVTEEFKPFITERRMPERAEIVRLSESGMTYQQIADRYGVTRQAVGKEMLKAKRERQAAEEAAAVAEFKAATVEPDAD